MPDATENEWTIIENAFEKVIQALAEDNSPAASELKQTCLEAQQIASAKLGDASGMSGDGIPKGTGQNTAGVSGTSGN